MRGDDTYPVSPRKVHGRGGSRAAERLGGSRTKHAQERKAQRGISDLQVQLIELFGEDHLQKGGTMFSRIPDRKLAQLRAAIERCAGLALIKGHGDCVVTVFHQYRPVRHTEWTA